MRGVVGVLVTVVVVGACAGQSKDSAFLHALYAEPPVNSLNIASVSDATLTRVGHEICRDLAAIASPTFTRDLVPLVEKKIAPELVGAHRENVAPGHVDNAPVVLGYGIAQAAATKLCPAERSALND